MNHRNRSRHDIAFSAFPMVYFFFYLVLVWHTDYLLYFNVRSDYRDERLFCFCARPPHGDA